MSVKNSKKSVLKNIFLYNFVKKRKRTETILQCGPLPFLQNYFLTLKFFKSKLLFSYTVIFNLDFFSETFDRHILHVLLNELLVQN